MRLGLREETEAETVVVATDGYPKRAPRPAQGLIVPTRGQVLTQPFDRAMGDILVGCRLALRRSDRWGPQGSQNSSPYEQIGQRALLHPAIRTEFQNRARELQDLLLNSDQAWKLVDEIVSIITDEPPRIIPNGDPIDPGRGRGGTPPLGLLALPVRCRRAEPGLWATITKHHTRLAIRGARRGCPRHPGCCRARISRGW